VVELRLLVEFLVRFAAHAPRIRSHPGLVQPGDA
jgi:hypothetical protein